MTSHKFKGPLRYLLVGGIAYLTEMAVLVVARDGLKFGSLTAVAISFWVGFIISFVLQKIFAFKNHETGFTVLGRQLGLYALLVAFNFGFTLLLVRLFDNTFSVYLIRTIAIFIITSWNYLVYKRIFKIQDTSQVPVE